MKVSIIVPNLDYRRYLRECLESIVAQTYKDIEVILVDAGSEDGSQDVMREYAERYGWRYEVHAGESQIESISWGLSVATGEVQGWLNSDDVYVSSDAIARVVAAFNALRSVDCVSFGGYYLDAEGHYTSRILLLAHPLFRQSDIRFRTGGFVQPATFWKRGMFAEIGFDRKLPHSFDSDFLLCACRSYNVVIDQQLVLAGYRLHGANLSVGVKWKRVAELARLNRKHFGVGLRYFYLMLLSFVVRALDVLPRVVGGPVKRALYGMNNIVSFMTIYRWPSI